jgi:pimaricinolide synthase PimS1
LGLEWAEVPLAEHADAGPEVELRHCETRSDAPSAEAALELARDTLKTVQQWLGDESKADSRLAFITQGAMATGGDESPDPTAAAVWGFVRSAQSEHPGRFVLIDSDGTDASLEALPAALAIGTEEPQLALRDGVALVPRLARLHEGEVVEEAPPLIDPERTVLITGATGGLGALVARHLAEHHDARHLLLVSRSGPEAEGAKELREWLEGMGAEATIAACDVSDRKALGKLLSSIPSEYPLGAVIHCAGAIADGTVEAMGEGQLERVFAPKVDAAWNLHELTESLDLSAYVLFSSAVGTLGGPGQANYAAANVFLDALAQRRRAEGLPATSIAWGLWERASGMAAGLGEADLMRMRRAGVEALSDERGLALFDAATSADRAVSLAMPLDPAGLMAVASAGALPPIFSGLVRVPKRRGAASGSLAVKLGTLPETEREGYVLGLVRREVAAVLGHASAQQVEPDKAFQELGFDSLAAVELRNRLSAIAGLRLSATVVFDYPSSAALAEHLLAGATAGGAARQVVVRAQVSEEPIAIVGMACRYPGGVSSPEGLWQLVAEGRDGISEFPADRGWDLERLYDPDPEHPGTSYTREGGFLAEAAAFDPDFFAISPREAEVMDPQERLLLESCWEALEDAGIDPVSLRKTQTGVFAGVGERSYGPAPGMTSSIVSGRVSYALGLEGPAISIDTACSSSLVAMHLAAGALRQGECTLALAGGVTVLSTPTTFIAFSAQRGLAPDGRCKSFADAADGTGWAEGVGVLAMERLSDARRNGHPVLALLRGSAINQDGASNGLTAPNGPSQERVIRQALANARLATNDVDVVEAHGTGTTLGDPIEAGALLATYGQERERPLKLGSIKSNIGHTQAAAGVAGVIKMAMAMRAGVLPKTLHVDSPSSNVDWEAGEIELLSEQLPWDSNGRSRRAGISSFGISGTNAHVILEEAPAPDPATDASEDGGEAPASQSLVGPIPFALSAKAEAALAQAAARLAAHLTENPELDATDVAYSLATTRAAFEHRAVVLGVDREELLASLASLANGDPSSNVLSARAQDGKLAYLFTGQGSQRLGMGADLYGADPDFREAFDAVCEQLDSHLETPLKEIVFTEGKKAAKRLEDTAYAQPALFAIEVALYKALAKRGLSPNLLAGHSIGEIAAAHVAGVLSLADAATLVAARGRLMSALPAGGAMAAVEASEDEAAESIAGKEAELSIAAINGPTSTVISGAEEAVEAVRSEWEGKGRKTKRLAVSHAFHSPLMEPMLEEFAEVAESLTYSEPKIAIVSNLSGELLSAEQATDPAYWVRHVREPVRFADAIKALGEQGTSTYLELGPDPVLCAMARECLGEDDRAAFVPTLRDGRPEAGAISIAIAHAHASGTKLEWGAFFAGTGARRVPLPTYPFQHKRYWLASTAGRLGDLAAAADHPLLGTTVELADGKGGGLLLTGRLSLSTHPWLVDHTVDGAALLPGTAFLELALRAAEQAGAEGIEELVLQAPLVLPERGAVALQVAVGGPDEDGRREIAIHSRPEGEEGEWILSATGALSEQAADVSESLDAWPPDGAEPVEIDYLYDQLAEHGLEYGPAFQSLTAAWREGERIYAEVSLPEERAEEAERFGIHPALLDSALHGIRLTTGSGSAELTLPSSWSGVSLVAEGARELRVRVAPTEGEGVSVLIADSTGAPVALVEAMTSRPLDSAQLQGAGQMKGGLLGIDWTEAAIAERDTAPPEVELLHCEIDGGVPTAEAAHEAAKSALEAIQQWLADESKADSRLALITNDAMATADDEAPDPAAAAVWGLVRSAQSEHPGRFALIDSDGTEASQAALTAALAIGAEEPQLALREGKALVPRLTRLSAGEVGEAAAIDPERTVLVTGGTGGLGALVARHLAECHGARHLLLLSRSGRDAEGADELKAGLEELGAETTIAACDVSDRKALKKILASIPAEHPLGAVIHCAGSIADGTVETMTAEQIERVLTPKADAAWNLHELTQDAELSAFILFSSAAGVFGGPGQGNYAAANVFLDALAQRRQAEGLPATAIAWGLWERASGMASSLGEADLMRMRRSGVEALSDERGLALFDSALYTDRATPLAIPLNTAGLRVMASIGALPPIFNGLLRTSRRRSASSGSLATKLAALPEAERESYVLDLVRTQVAAILGHASPREIEPGRAFQELGFDSLAAIELRNRLSAATGLSLAPALVFDYPSAAAITAKLLSDVSAETDLEALREGEVKELLVKLEATLSSLEPTDGVRERASTRLRSLLVSLSDADSPEVGESAEDLASMSHDEMFELIDEEFGSRE